MQWPYVYTLSDADQRAEQERLARLRALERELDLYFLEHAGLYSEQDEEP